MNKYKIKTIKNDECYLRQVSTDVELNDNKINEYVKALSNYCNQNKLFALAGIQLGIPKNIIYIRNSNEETDNDNNYDEKSVMLNPKIINEKGNTYFWEACASCLDNTCYIRRPYEITIEYFNLKGEKNAKTFYGFISTILSHEYDHLLGILHIDKAEKILHLTKEERVELRKKEPYLIIDKEKEYIGLKNKE